MPYTLDRVDAWKTTISDKPGALNAVLEGLAEAGVALEFVTARRAKPGEGVCYVVGVSGAKQARAAVGAGLNKATDICVLRVEGPDKIGLGACIAGALADAGLNLRAATASAIGRKCVFYVALDTSKDAAKAKRALSKALPIKK